MQQIFCLILLVDWKKIKTLLFFLCFVHFWNCKIQEKKQTKTIKIKKQHTKRVNAWRFCLINNPVFDIQSKNTTTYRSGSAQEPQGSACFFLCVKQKYTKKRKILRKYFKKKNNNKTQRVGIEWANHALRVSVKKSVSNFIFFTLFCFVTVPNIFPENSQIFK